MSYIELFESRRPLGTFNLPASVTGVGGHSFTLRSVAKGGGNGIVFRASPQGTLATTDDIEACAVKFLRQRDVTRIDRFDNEQRILAELDHEHIVQYFDHGEILLGTHQVPWVAMELGEDNLRQHIIEKGPLSRDRMKRVACQIASALQHVHEKGIIHRDLKPDNFVWSDEAAQDVKMIDFGIAKHIGVDVSGRPLDQFTQHLEFVGPVFYSSPELVAYSMDKSHPVDQRSDLFQLGKVLWFLATGAISAGIPARSRCPFDGRLHALVYQLLNDDPAERLQDSAAVVDAVRGL